MEKEILVENVNSWVKLDNDILKLQSQIRDLKKKKTEITNILVDVMRKNNVDSFDMKDDSLLYKKTIVKQPINKKMLLEALQKFYEKDETNIAEKLVEHVLEQRQTKTRETIKRKSQ
jgi:hypothetical protein